MINPAMDEEQDREEQEFVKVSIRIRPKVCEDSSFGSNLKIINEDPPILFLIDRQQSYTFDHVFTEESTQESVYSATVEPLIEKVLTGYNCTVFAYGQTGTGKTYTMGTSCNNGQDDDEGLIVRAFNSLFSVDDENKETEIHVSFLEIYNEKIYDLLSSHKEVLQIKGFNVVNLKKQRVFNIADVKHMLLDSAQKRHIGKTKQNSESSRSHAVFTIYCTVRDENDEIVAKLNLVDLAGSESAKKTGNEGSQFYEGISINKGLLYIGQVINALSENKFNVPYRQCTITKILQDSLNRKNFVSLVACISPHAGDLHETIQTLEFSQRAKKIKNRPQINTIVTQYTKEHPTLFDTSNIKTIKKSRALSNIISSSKKGCTPVKRPASRIFTSTTVKKPCYANSTMIKYSDIEYRAGSDKVTLPSLNVSSTSTIYETPQTYSPIIRKCIDAVEATMYKNLNTIVKEEFSEILQSTLKGIKLSVPVSSGQTTPTFNKENGAFGINKRKNIVTRLSFTDSANKVALEEIPVNISGVYQTLQNASLNTSNSDSPKNFINGNYKINSPIFKLPIGIPKRKKIAQASVLPQISETRRVTRLSLKRQIMCTDDLTVDESFAEIDKKKSYDSVRRSKRLTLKQIPKTPTPLPRNRVTNKSLKPAPAPTRTAKASKEKIITLSHSERVLDILNNGNAKDLRTLFTVGEKTAGKILLYRQLKGEFLSILDVRNVLSYGSAYSKFLKANFLEDEE